jgi:hypothetical protein
MDPFPLDIRKLYDHFDAPVTEVDCGEMCRHHNPSGKPFCCDICHAVPAAYLQEWDYLKGQTHLWHEWRGDECDSKIEDHQQLSADMPEYMCLLACLGPDHCQRDFRSMSCRQFPFFPYITADDRFIGMTYYWDFEPYCWVISNLGAVTDQFRREFFTTYDALLNEWEEEYDSYYYLSEDMRTAFARHRWRIPILHRNGGCYLLSPGNERLTRVEPRQFRQFGFYQAKKG